MKSAVAVDRSVVTTNPFFRAALQYYYNFAALLYYTGYVLYNRGQKFSDVNRLKFKTFAVASRTKRRKWRENHSVDPFLTLPAHYPATPIIHRPPDRNSLCFLPVRDGAFKSWYVSDSSDPVSHPIHTISHPLFTSIHYTYIIAVYM